MSSVGRGGSHRELQVGPFLLLTGKKFVQTTFRS